MKKPRCFPTYCKGSIIVMLTLCFNKYGVSSLTWTRMSSSGYSYWLSTNSKSYNNARKYCFEQESTLAIIKTDAERNFIESNILYNVNSDVWIGANLNVGKWYFIDGSELDENNYSSTPWGPGNPDDDYDEMCGAIDNDSLRWKDHHCDDKEFFLCQKFPNNFGCPSNNWFRVTWSPVCYRKYNMPRNYDSAMSTCNEDGYDIFMPKTKDQDIFMSWYIDNYMNKDVWVGYTDRVQEGSFVWNSGNQSSYTGWSNNEPQPYSSDCVAYSSNYDNKQQLLHPKVWFTRGCSNSNAIICQSTRYFQVINSTSHMTSSSLSTAAETTEAISTQQETTQTTKLSTDGATTDATTTQDELTTKLIATTDDDTTPTVTLSSGSSGCFCSCHVMNISSEEYLQLFYDSVLKTLEVNQSSISKNVRKRTSASDERESSQQIGAVGIAFLVTSLSLLIILDFIPRA